jgi:glycosyltransferase involved in cell wall biosynthesis
MVEAMLCSRPIVATDIAGHAEIVEDGVTCFLADVPTPRAMAAALERFWAPHGGRRDRQSRAHRIQQLVPPSRCASLQKTSRRCAG